MNIKLRGSCHWLITAVGTRHISQAFSNKSHHVLKLALPGPVSFQNYHHDETDITRQNMIESGDFQQIPKLQTDDSAPPDLNKFSQRIDPQLLNSNGKLPLDYQHYKNIAAANNVPGSSLNNLNKTLIEAFRRERVTATDLTTKYCEAKYFYDLAVGVSRETTPSMTRGTTIHDLLEFQVQGPKIAIPVTDKLAEQWALKLYKTANALYQLATRSVVREMYLFGQYEDQLITGIIDLVQIQSQTPFCGDQNDRSNNLLVIIDTKTRNSSSLPGPTELESAYHQVLIYNKLLRNLTDGRFDFEFLYKKIGLDPDYVISQELVQHFKFQMAPEGLPISNGKPFAIEEDAGLVAEHRYFLKRNHQALQINNDVFLNDSSFRHFIRATSHRTDPTQQQQYSLTIRDLEKLIKFLARTLQGTISPNVQVQYMNLKQKHTLEDAFAVSDAVLEDSKNGTFNVVNEIATFQYQYDDQRLNELFSYSMGFWRNTRTPMGVRPSEVSKCGHCRWEKVCSWKYQLDFSESV